MIKIINILIVSILPVLFVCCSSSSGTISNEIFPEPGAEVFIVMNDNQEYEGELLFVRDSIMLLSEEVEVDEEDIANLIYPIYSIKNHDIKFIEIEGVNKIVTWLFIGASTGLLVGVVIGATKSEGGKKGNNDGLINFRFSKGFGSSIACCLGGMMGALLGVLLGISESTDDEVVYEYADPETFDFTQLNIYSRYGDKEPEYIKDIK